MPCEGVRAEEGRVLGPEGAPGKYKLSWASEYCSLARRRVCSRWPGAALRGREGSGRQGARPSGTDAEGPRGRLAGEERTPQTRNLWSLALLLCGQLPNTH